jgi:hypothetical protein
MGAGQDAVRRTRRYAGEGGGVKGDWEPPIEEQLEKIPVRGVLS